MKRLLLFLAVLSLAGSAFAHDLVLFMRGPDLVVRFGHPAEWEVAEWPKVTELNAWVAGRDQPIPLLEQKPARAEPDWILANVAGGGAVTWLTGQYDNGYWSEAAGGKYFNTSKLNLPTAKTSGNYPKYSKGLLAAGAVDFQHRFGHRLEIVLQKNPFALKVGDFLPVLVLFEGVPLIGAKVEIGDGKMKMKEEDIAKYPTDAQGIAQLPIQHGGQQIIAIDHQIPPALPALCDHDDPSASLTFELFSSGDR